MLFTGYCSQLLPALTTHERLRQIPCIVNNMEQLAAHRGVPRSTMRNIFPLMVLIAVSGCSRDHSPAADTAPASYSSQSTASVPAPDSPAVTATDSPPHTAQTPDATPEATPNGDAVTRGPDDIALECRYANREGPTMVLIYAPRYGLKEILSENPDGQFEMEYRINRMSSTTDYVTLDVTSTSAVVARAINPSAKIEPESLTINRETLDMVYRTDTELAGLLTWDYRCDLLSNEEFAVHVQAHLDDARRLKEAEEEQKLRNKI